MWGKDVKNPKTNLSIKIIFNKKMPGFVYKFFKLPYEIIVFSSINCVAQCGRSVLPFKKLIHIYKAYLKGQ
jgi:hypothetical protein